MGTPTWNSYQSFRDGARWRLETHSVGCVPSLGTIILSLCIIPTATIVCRNLTEHGGPLNPWVSVLQYQHNLFRSSGKNQLKSVVMLKRNATKNLPFHEVLPSIYFIYLYCLWKKEWLSRPAEQTYFPCRFISVWLFNSGMTMFPCLPKRVRWSKIWIRARLYSRKETWLADKPDYIHANNL